MRLDFVGRRNGTPACRMAFPTDRGCDMSVTRQAPWGAGVDQSSNSANETKHRWLPSSEALLCPHPDRSRGDCGGRGVGDRALARPEAAGGEPTVVGEIDCGADLDVAQKDERERVRGGGGVLNDGDVAGGEHDS